MFDAIEGDVDAAHHLMHAALGGYHADAATWRLADLPTYTPPAEGDRNSAVPDALIEEWAAQRCPLGDACPKLADDACPLWHDHRELRFAKVLAAPFAPTAPERGVEYACTCTLSLIHISEPTMRNRDCSLVCCLLYTSPSPRD